MKNLYTAIVLVLTGRTANLFYFHLKIISWNFLSDYIPVYKHGIVTWLASPGDILQLCGIFFALYWSLWFLWLRHARHMTPTVTR